MNSERLGHMITILEGVERARMAFNLDSWGSLFEPEDDADTTTNVEQAHACGTTCCAFGYAALDDRFRGEGLILYSFDENKREVVEFRSIQDFNEKMRSGKVDPWAIPRFGNMLGLDAAMEFFGLTYHQACWLFTPEEYLSYEAWRRDEHDYRVVTPSEVIERIRHVLAGGDVMTNQGRAEREEEEGIVA